MVSSGGVMGPQGLVGPQGLTFKRDDSSGKYLNYQRGDTCLIHLVRVADIHPELLEWAPKYSDQINQHNSYGDSPLLIAVKTESSERVVPLLLSMGANINLQNCEGKTALMIAFKKGNYGAVYQLINSGAKLNIKDGGGNTALINCLSKFEVAPRAELIKLLLEKGANRKLKNKNGKTAVYKANKANNSWSVNWDLEELNKIKELLKNYYPPVSYRNYDLQNTPTQQNMMYLAYLNRRLYLFPKDIEKMIIPYLKDEAYADGNDKEEKSILKRFFGW